MVNRRLFIQKAATVSLLLPVLRSPAARSFSAGSSRYFYDAATSPVAACPFTMGCWVKASSPPQMAVMSLNDTSTGMRAVLSYNFASSGFWEASFYSPTLFIAPHTSSPSGLWQLFVGQFRWDGANRYAQPFVNGVAGTELSTAQATAPAFNTIGIGARNNGSGWGFPATMTSAHHFLVGRLLSTDEHAALKTHHPLLAIGQSDAYPLWVSDLDGEKQNEPILTHGRSLVSVADPTPSTDGPHIITP